MVDFCNSLHVWSWDIWLWGIVLVGTLLWGIVLWGMALWGNVMWGTVLWGTVLEPFLPYKSQSLEGTPSKQKHSLRPISRYSYPDFSSSANPEKEMSFFVKSIALWAEAFLLHFLIAYVEAEQIKMETALKPIFHGPCVAFIYKDLEEFSLLDMMESADPVIEQSTFMLSSIPDFPVQRFAKMSKCIIGISRMENIQELQAALLPTYNRQLIAICSNCTHHGYKRRNFRLHRFHHPPYVIQSLENKILQLTACKERLALTNIYSGKWLHLFHVDSLSAERICNHGKHPLHSTKLYTSVQAVAPYTILDSNGKIAGGIVPSLIRTLSQHLSFDYEIALTDLVFGFERNGSVTGSMGDVVHGRKDISLEQAMMVANSFGQLTTLTHYVFFVFVEPKPTELSRLKNITYPFDIYTWVAFLFASLIVSIALHFVTRDQSNRPWVKKFTMTDILMIVIGCIFQEYNQRGKACSGTLFRWTRMLWVVVTFLIVMAFSGNLKSSLIRKTYEKITYTLHEMIDKDRPIYLSSTFVDYLESTRSVSTLNDRLARQVAKKDSIWRVGISPQELIELLQQESATGMLFEPIVEMKRLEYHRNGSSFPLLIIPEWYAMMGHAMMFQMFDPRAEYFNKPLHWLKDAGIINGYFNKFVPLENRDEVADSKEEALTLEHIVLPLLFSVAALFLSICTFAWEFF